MSKQLTQWQKFFDKEFLGSHNFDDNEEKVVTVVEAKQQEVTLPGGKKETCLVVHFKPEGEEPVKPMVVNVTNAKAIQKVSGSRYIENWPGTELTLYVDHNVKYAGKKVDGIRVKVDANMKAQKETLTKDHPKYADVVAAMKDKGYKISQIRIKYNVSADVEAQLEKDIK